MKLSVKYLPYGMGFMAILAVLFLWAGNAPAPICLNCFFYNYVTPAVQVSVHDPVDPVTGNFAEQATDLSYPTAGVPLAVIRYYSSRFASTNGPLGAGWAFNLNMYVKDTFTGKAVFWGDGHGDDFTVDGTSGNETSYAPVHGDTGYTLTETSNSTSHYFTVHVKNIDRTIRFGHEEGGAFYPTVMFHGQDENATSAFPMTFTYSDGPPKTLVVKDEKSGRAITVTYDDSGRIISAKGPDGATVTYAYDENGDLVTVTRADGSVVNYVYDDAHHLTEIRQGGKTLLKNTYDWDGRVLTQTDALGNTTTFSYDPDSSKNTITGPDGKKTFYYYDSQYRITKIEDEDGASRTYTYDGDSSRLASITEPDGATTTFSYDADGNLIQKTDPSGRSYTYTYNDQGRLLSSSTPGGITAHFTHDAEGRLAGYTLPEGGAYALSYGADGKLASITDPLGKSETYGRAPSGLLSSTTRRDGVTVSFLRDAAGRVIQKTFGGAHPVTYTYDALGRVVSVEDASGTVTYTYGERGKRLSRKGPDGETVSYTYDDAGRLSSIHVAGLDLLTNRDEAGRPVSVSDGFGHTLAYSYDDKGRLQQVSGPGGVSVSYTFDANGRVAGITFSKDGAAFRSMTIQRDETGAITHVSDNGAPDASALPAPLSLGFNAADRITSAIYDQEGRLLARSGKSYTYDTLGRLTAITMGQSTAAISYGPEGRPLEITDQGAAFTLVYSGAVPMCEKDASGDVLRYFVFGRGMSFVLDADGNIEAMLLSDYRRNFVAALDASGNLLSQRTYSPYGLVLGEEGAWPVPFGFMGEAGLYTLSTGEILTRNRAYDPESARFLTPDPSAPNPFEPRSLNRYAYAWQDPVNLVDTSGLSPFEPTGPRWLIPCVGGVIGCNVRPTMHPTNTLAGVAGPPMSGPSGILSPPGASNMVADSTPIYSDRTADQGGGNPALTPNFSSAEGLVASFYALASSSGESEPPPGDPVAVAPGSGYVASFYCWASTSSG